MKIYTKSGDKGTTSLFDGERVTKNHQRIEAYGTVDELNTHLAELRLLIQDSDTQDLIFDIQKGLFAIGAFLAGAYQDKDDIPGIDQSHITRLESKIDEYQSSLPKLKSFVIPGGNVSSAKAHVCRTVCRRAERRVVEIMADGTRQLFVVQYLNRLSDYLFVLSRKLIYDKGDQEVLWTS